MVVSVATEHRDSRPDVYAAVIWNPQREGDFSLFVPQHELAVLHQDFVILGRDWFFGKHHVIFPGDEQLCGPSHCPARPDINLDWQ